MLALTVIIGLIGTHVLLSRITPLYSASVQLLIDTRKQAIERDAALSGLSLDTGAIESEVALMRSFEIAKRVVESLHLNKTPPNLNKDPANLNKDPANLDKDPPIAAEPSEGFWSVLWRMIWEPETAAQPPDPSDVAQSSAAQSGAARQADPLSKASEVKGVDPQTMAAIERVRSATQVRRVGLTYAIEITYSSPDPIMAAKIANALADAYLKEQLEAQLGAARRAADWLAERLVGLKQSMEQSARAITQYKNEHEILETTSGGIEKQQLTELSLQLVRARMITMEKKARYDHVRGTSEGGGANLKFEYEVALRREQELEKTFQRAADRQESLDDASVRLRELEREAESNSLIYQTYLQRYKEASENKSLERRETRVITPADPPSSPSYPRHRIFYFAAVSLSLIVGVAASMLLETFKNGFMTAEEVETHLHFPVIATIATLAQKDLKQKGRRLSLPEYVMAKPASRTGEAMCAIRVRLQLSDAKDPPCVVLFTSSVTGEGKSAVAQSFACSAVVAGQRVALIDADLRHPSMSRAFGVADERGLSDYLLGQEPIDRVTKALHDGKLLLLPAGTSKGNTADLLGSETMRALLLLLKENYDFVVIDSPPLASVIDAAVLAKIVDTMIYVVNWEKVPREVVARAIETIGEDRDKIAGVILNKANIRRMSQYLPYYSYYNTRKYTKYYDGSA